METKVKVKFTADESLKSIGSFTLLFRDNEKNELHSVDVKFEFKELWEFSQDTSSVAFDFLILSMLVYNVDRMLKRECTSSDGWYRNIKLVDVPAINLGKMNRGKEFFNKAVSFLTGDNWNINFTQASAYNYSPVSKHNYNIAEYEKVSLFSGGLDSLIGFIDEASTLSNNKKILLISHKEQGKEGKDQDRILNKCRAQQNLFFNEQFTRVQVNAGIKASTWTNKMKTESTFRSRSLLFFAMGIYAAHRINNEMQVIVPENGTISINIPLDKGRRSACSTRTTHPTFIKKLHFALSTIGINNKLFNPYKFKSKADMMEDCFADLNKKMILTSLYSESCSCAKRSHNSYWKQRGNGLCHCGICLPCIYRRVALNKVVLDDETKLGINLFEWSSFELTDETYKQYKRFRDFKALLLFLATRHNRSIIRGELLLNGVTDLNDLERYVDLAMHSYDQVRDWINQKGSDDVKRMAGIL